MKLDNASDCVTYQAVLDLCQDLDTSRALTVAILIRYSEFTQLADLDIDPSRYLNASSFSKDYMITTLLKKFKGLDSKINTRDVALDSWKAAELKCQETNRRIRDASKEVKSSLGPILYRAQMKIAAVLGPLKVSSLLERGRWGPGATSDLRRNAGLDNKLSCNPTVTPRCVRYARAVIEADPLWFESITGQRPEGPFSILVSSIFQKSEGSRFLTVPKNAKTDRCISAEPTMNGFIQGGVGRFIRDRLALVGVRLDDQSRNRDLAAKASVLHLATLDLSAASDTISSGLVFSLLPPEWSDFLDDIRSHYTSIDGSLVHLEKFSSMGNGFTFELETLIFWALATSVTEKYDRDRFAVYGDDLIVDRSLAAVIVETLEFCGFSVNQSKSYFSGSFFESCGGHFFEGCDVTPIYQKEEITSLSELVRFHNRLKRWSWRTSVVDHRDYTRRVCRSLRALSNVPIAIPFGAHGDDGFLLPRKAFDYCPNHGYYSRVLVSSSINREANELSLFALKLRAPQYNFPRKRKIPTGASKYRLSFRYINLHDMTDENWRNRLVN
jgi:hypothetical protein